MMEGERQHRELTSSQERILSLAEVVCRVIGIPTKPEVLGLENVPAKPPYIVSCNHRGIVEAMALWEALPHWVYYMTRAKTIKMPVIGQLARWAGLFPVQRGEADRKALETTDDILTTSAVGIFFEGTRGTKDTLTLLKPVKRGAAYVAIRAQVPVVPIGIVGPENYLAQIDKQPLSETAKELWQIRRRPDNPPVRVAIGKPITEHIGVELQGRELLEATTALTETIAKAIKEQLIILEPDRTDYYKNDVWPPWKW